MSIIIAKNKVSAEELATVKTPEATESFTPISHALLVDQMREAIARAGYGVKEEEHALARMGQRYFGGFVITGKDFDATDRQLVLGLRNSTDKSFAASVCIGTSMIVCENLCFSSNIKLARKHTTNILRDIPRVLSEAVGRCVSHFTDMTNRIENYKTIELSNDEAAGLIVQLADSAALPAREVYPTMKQFRAPNHPEFAGRTLWSLYNGVTECLKSGDLNKLPARTMMMQSIFDARSGHRPIIEAEIDKSELVMEA